MALPASGAIAFSDINTELGCSAGTAVSLNQADVRSLFGIASGAISMNQGYGCSGSFDFGTLQHGCCYADFGGWYIGSACSAASGCWYMFDSGSNNADNYAFGTSSGSPADYAQDSGYYNGGRWLSCYEQGCYAQSHPSVDQYLTNFSCRGFTDWYWTGGEACAAKNQANIPYVYQGEFNDSYGATPNTAHNQGGAGYNGPRSATACRCGYKSGIPAFTGRDFFSTTSQSSATHTLYCRVSASDHGLIAPYNYQTHAYKGHRPIRQEFDPNCRLNCYPL